MAYAKVLSVKGMEPVAEEFYAEADTLEAAAVLLLENEERVATQDWMAWFAYNAGYHYDPEGYDFTMIDNGGAEIITYHYYVHHV